MKAVLIIAMLLTAIAGKAQAPDTIKNEYCELIGAGKMFTTSKVSVTIDFGERSGKDAKLRAEQLEKVKAFNTMVDALNYMNDFGWELSQTFVVGGGNANIYHWVLKRKRPR